jgi:hypothetical protein
MQRITIKRSFRYSIFISESIFQKVCGGIKGVLNNFLIENIPRKNPINAKGIAKMV